MTTFYVGQRVRMVRPVRSCNLGRTGRIAELYPREQPTVEATVNCAVDWDDGGRDSRFHNPGGFATHTRQLEPILPSGHQPAELSAEELLPFLKGKRVQA